MNIKVGVGDKRLVSSGTVHVNGNDKVTIELIDNNLKIIFSFEETRDVSGSHYNGVGEGSTYNVILYNFNNPFGEGVVTPISIGRVDGKELFMSFFIFSLQNNERRFEYNIFVSN